MRLTMNKYVIVQTGTGDLFVFPDTGGHTGVIVGKLTAPNAEMAFMVFLTVLCRHAS